MAEDNDGDQPENSVPKWPSVITVIEDEHRLQEVHEVWIDNGSQGAVDNWSGGPLNPRRMHQSVPNRRLTRFHPPDDGNVYSIELRELLNSFLSLYLHVVSFFWGTLSCILVVSVRACIS